MNPADRRKYARMPLATAANLSDFREGKWSAQTVDVSPFGVKIALADADLKIRPGDSLRLSFQPGDGERQIETLVSVVRVDRDSVAIAFVNLEMENFRRLSKLVDDWARVNVRP